MIHMFLKLKSFTNVTHLNLQTQTRLTSLPSEQSTYILYCVLNEDAVFYPHGGQEKGLACHHAIERAPDLPEWRMNTSA